MKSDILGILKMAQRHLILLDSLRNGQINIQDLEDQYEVISAAEILEELITNIAIVQSTPTSAPLSTSVELEEFLRIYCLKKEIKEVRS
ncbi:hypothetical protein QUA70_19735 [Microcoleus sp. LAD1_D5]|uniref:hypothetical protein n=1 Tax=Microcoleus sp. LAD1_D5 TaxID=2818813 RepID=UPI002FD7153B